jgi:hypothetical protein
MSVLGKKVKLKDKNTLESASTCTSAIFVSATVKAFYHIERYQRLGLYVRSAVQTGIKETHSL